jgi:hypothetical protein
MIPLYDPWNVNKMNEKNEWIRSRGVWVLWEREKAPPLLGLEPLSSSMGPDHFTD